MKKPTLIKHTVHDQPEDEVVHRIACIIREGKEWEDDVERAKEAIKSHLWRMIDTIEDERTRNVNKGTCP